MCGSDVTFPSLHNPMFPALNYLVFPLSLFPMFYPVSSSVSLQQGFLSVPLLLLHFPVAFVAILSGQFLLRSCAHYIPYTVCWLHLPCILSHPVMETSLSLTPTGKGMGTNTLKVAIAKHSTLCSLFIAWAFFVPIKDISSFLCKFQCKFQEVGGSSN